MAQLDVTSQTATQPTPITSLLLLHPHHQGGEWEARWASGSENSLRKPEAEAQALSLEPRVGPQLPQIFYYYCLNTTTALFLKSAAFEQFRLTSAGCQQLWLENRNNQIF